MNASGIDVREAIVDSLSPGQELYTPTRRSFFTIESLGDPQGVTVSKLAGPILWEALNGVPDYLASQGNEVAIGAKKGRADPQTLESFLQARHRNVTQRASYVAPILEAAGVIDILPIVPGEKQRIRLRPEWFPNV